MGLKNIISQFDHIKNDCSKLREETRGKKLKRLGSAKFLQGFEIPTLLEIKRGTVHAQLNIFEKTLLKVVSSHLYASFGTSCVWIVWLF